LGLGPPCLLAAGLAPPKFKSSTFPTRFLFLPKRAYGKHIGFSFGKRGVSTRYLWEKQRFPTLASGREYR
jgi:hypothetical protein